jgi:hypothetical protein
MALADSDSKQRTDGRFVGDRAGCANAGDVFIAEKGGGKAGRGDAFQGGGKGGKGKSGGRGGRGISADEIVDRIMSFDKNKDGKVTKDELPERMQFLIERGDTNKDGALDRDEVKKLAADLARDGFRGFDGFGGGRGGFGPGGFGGRGGFGPPAGFGPGPGTRADQALNDLKLNDKTKDKAEAIIKAHEESVRKLLDLARGDLLLKMKDVLSEQEYKNFKDALERQPGPPGPRVSARDERPATPAASSTGKTADLEKKLDQLQKDLETLRRELRR